MSECSFPGRREAASWKREAKICSAERGGLPYQYTIAVAIASFLIFDWPCDVVARVLDLSCDVVSSCFFYILVMRDLMLFPRWPRSRQL